MYCMYVCMYVCVTITICVYVCIYVCRCRRAIWLYRAGMSLNDENHYCVCMYVCMYGMY